MRARPRDALLRPLLAARLRRIAAAGRRAGRRDDRQAAGAGGADREPAGGGGGPGGVGRARAGLVLACGRGADAEGLGPMQAMTTYQDAAAPCPSR